MCLNFIDFYLLLLSNISNKLDIGGQSTLIKTFITLENNKFMENSPFNAPTGTILARFLIKLIH